MVNVYNFQNQKFMSNYKDRKDFIARTKEILENEPSSKYEKTAFLNCCMGLLVAPQQWDNNLQFPVPGDVDESWGIDCSLIKQNVHKKGKTSCSVENIAYHFRNSLCHFLFSVNNCNDSSFEHIHIQDKLSGGKTVSFDMTIDFEDFKKFVTKYADEKLKLLKDE